MSREKGPDHHWLNLTKDQNCTVLCVLQLFSPRLREGILNAALFLESQSIPVRPAWTIGHKRTCGGIHTVHC